MKNSSSLFCRRSYRRFVDHSHRAKPAARSSGASSRWFGAAADAYGHGSNDAADAGAVPRHDTEHATELQSMMQQMMQGRMGHDGWRYASPTG